MRIAYLVMKYPTLSQTFIEREMRALAKQGFEIVIYPCFDFRKQTKADEKDTELKVVRTGFLKVFKNACLEILRMIKSQRGRHQIYQALSAFFRYLPKNREGRFMTVLGTVYGLSQAETFRKEIALNSQQTKWFHAVWATAPATAAMVLSALCDLPFSFGAHAYDLFRHGGDPLLELKLGRATFVHTTTDAAAKHLETFANRQAEIVLARRGLTQLPILNFDVTQKKVEAFPTKTIQILSVGRLVEKKGHIFQLSACFKLKQKGIPFRLTIVGDGPLLELLTKCINELKLQNEIIFAGALSQDQVSQAYKTADIFWHTGIVDSQGDRDGLPNVVPEAMSYALPVISTAAGGASEAIEDHYNGIIVESAENIMGLADAVEELAENPALRKRLGIEARRWVEENFIAVKNTQKLALQFKKMEVG